MNVRRQKEKSSSSIRTSISLVVRSLADWNVFLYTSQAVNEFSGKPFAHKSGNTCKVSSKNQSNWSLFEMIVLITLLKSADAQTKSKQCYVETIKIKKYPCSKNQSDCRFFETIIL